MGGTNHDGKRGEINDSDSHSRHSHPRYLGHGDVHLSPPRLQLVPRPSGLAKSRLCEIETKGRTPSIFCLYALAMAYGVEIRRVLAFYLRIPEPERARSGSGYRTGRGSIPFQ